MFHDSHNETIIAQCTPSGPGAIALLRLSGTDAFAIIEQCAKLPTDKKISEQQTHTIHYGFVLDTQGSPIDQVLFLLMRAPHTFTGQDTIEITCHNNPFIIEAIIQRALLCGARIAQNGEFARRALINNKIDIIQAEAINDVIHANTQIALKQSLAQLKGSFSSWISEIEKKLIKALALSESSFEFLDEESMEFNIQITEIIQDVIETITQLKKTFESQQQVRQGIRIAIIGSVNAGKSSLFNALLHKERAIVTEKAGTTRDVIEAGLYKHGNYWTLIDTAGLRKTDDFIEQMGIERSHEEAKKADIILLVFDSSQQMSVAEQSIYTDLYQTYQHKVIVIANKADLPSTVIDDVFRNHLTLSVSSKTKTNMESIESAIQQKIINLFFHIESPFLLNKRHHNLLITLEQHLTTLIPMLTADLVAYELISYHLTDAIATISELTGKSVSEAGMDAIFREFCVGK